MRALRTVEEVFFFGRFGFGGGGVGVGVADFGGLAVAGDVGGMPPGDYG